jgi:hypothetical protein
VTSLNGSQMSNVGLASFEFPLVPTPPATVPSAVGGWTIDPSSPAEQPLSFHLIDSPASTITKLVRKFLLFFFRALSFLRTLSIFVSALQGRCR